jgi:LacI family transcriptional regulator
MKKRPTQTDVAQLAGVSRATVSYVINGVEDNQVSSETRDRVLAAVHELGYLPDAMAQSLRSGSTNTIGLLIPDMDNPHYWHVAKGVEQETQQHDYDLMLISSALDVDREHNSIKALSRRRMDGLILIVSYFEQVRAAIQRLMRQQRPLVLLNRQLDSVDYVGADLGVGAGQAMQHLLAHGHRRIGFIFGVASPELGSRRLDAYRDALETADIGVDEALIVHCGTTIEDGYQAAMRLLAQAPRPSAIMVVNDLLAFGALRAAIDCGLRVPDDLSITSFDDINFALYTQPRLTTVGIDATALGRTAAQMIFRRLQDPTLPPQQEALTSQLIVRDSTGPARE